MVSYMMWASIVYILKPTKNESGFIGSQMSGVLKVKLVACIRLYTDDVICE